MYISSCFIRVQYFVCPSPLSITSFRRLDILRTRLFSYSFDNSFTHIFHITLIRPLALDGCCMQTDSLLPYRFSIGLKWKQLPCHSRTFTLALMRKFVTTFDRWQGVSFCIRIVHLWICMCMLSLTDNSSTYRGLFIVVH